jgi:hypothetical protein
LVSSEFGSTSVRSRASWSPGTVVLRPHPGQGNPAQFTHDDGAVSARPAEELNDRMRLAPPTSYHKLVAVPIATGYPARQTC